MLSINSSGQFMPENKGRGDDTHERKITCEFSMGGGGRFLLYLA